MLYMLSYSPKNLRQTFATCDTVAHGSEGPPMEDERTTHSLTPKGKAWLDAELVRMGLPAVSDIPEDERVGYIEAVLKAYRELRHDATTE